MRCLCEGGQNAAVAAHHHCAQHGRRKFQRRQEEAQIHGPISRSRDGSRCETCQQQQIDDEKLPALAQPVVLRGAAPASRWRHLQYTKWREGDGGHHRKMPEVVVGQQ